MPSRFDGETILLFESRRGAEMGELVRKMGGEAIVAPTLREAPLDAQPEAEAAVRAMAAGEIDLVVLMTGVGTRALADIAGRVLGEGALAGLLERLPVVCRGPKPVAVLREWGLRPDWTAPEPNTWREVLAALDAGTSVMGRRIAVQEYGEPNRDLQEALRSRGADVVSVPVYRWEIPDDVEPVLTAIEELRRGGIAAALFTSQIQVRHLFRIAGARGHDLVDAFTGVAVGSIGPICSDAIREHGLPVAFEASPPRMGRLVRAAADALARARAGAT